MTSFGGIGVEIMTYRTQLEIELERVNSLMEQIVDRNTTVATLQENFSKFYLQKVYGFGGDLQKLTGATDLGKNLTTCKELIGKIHEELDALKQLQSECRQAQERAAAALPDYAKFITNGHLDVVPNRTFFLATKDATSPAVGRFELPARKQSADPMATLFDTQLSHRFQK
jgi:hypothetical protein